MTHREPFSRSFGTNETQQLREGQLVGRMLLQRLATGATAVKQARYRRGPTRGSEALYAHAQHNTRSLAMHGVLPRVLHFSALVLLGRMPCITFDRPSRLIHTRYNILKHTQYIDDDKIY